MGQDPNQLTDDITQTRRDLSSHLDELQDKVSPAAIVDRRKAAARERVGSVREKVMGTTRGTKDTVSGAGDRLSGTAGDAADTAKQQFQGSPLAAGAAAFGLGMVIAALIPASEAESRAAVQVKDTVQDRAQPLVEDAKSAAGEVGEQVKQSAAEAADQVKQTGQDAASRVQDEGASSAQNVRSEAPGA
jgi:ElaB/YqjD/DUF883 family membrane-anchored ribosome-binding protein